MSIRGARLSCDDHRASPAQGSQKRQNGCWLEAARAGPHDNKNTDEAGERCRPTTQAHLLAEQRYRERCDEHWGREARRRRFGNGKKRSEEMNRIDEVTRARARNTWSPGLRDRSTRRGPP